MKFSKLYSRDGYSWREFPYIDTWELPWFIYWFILILGFIILISYGLARLIL